MAKRLMTRKHRERLDLRNAARAERQQSRDYDRRAAALLAAEPEWKNLGLARCEVVRRDIERARAEYAIERGVASAYPRIPSGD